MNIIDNLAVWLIGLDFKKKLLLSYKKAKLEKSIENDEKLFTEYLEELAKVAIVSYDTPQISNINNYEIDEVDEKQSSKGEKELTQMTIQELKNKCKELNIKGYSKMKKEELIDIINKQ